jgi:predicted nucleic acid-binding protein
MLVAILVDTSALFAFADAASLDHVAMRDVVTNTPETLLVPVTVLPEADYLITTRLGGQVARAMLRSILDGELRVEHLARADLERCWELMDQYADSALGLVDASIIALAERLRITRVLTLDQRHFRFVRPRHCAAFEIVP